MSDVASTQATPPVVPNPTPGNDPAARAPDGSLKEPTSSTPPATPEPPKAIEPAAPKDPAAPKEPAKAADGPPEKYEFKAAEGKELDPKVVEAVTPIFKELGLTQDQAQKLVDFQAARDTELATAMEKVVNDTRNEWREKIAKDPTLGDGKDNLKPEVRANISKALDSLPAEAKAAVVKAFDLTGAGDNPAVVAAMNHFGKLLSEGTSVRGGGPSSEGQRAPGAPTRPSLAQALYPNNPSSATKAS